MVSRFHGFIKIGVGIGIGIGIAIGIAIGIGIGIAIGIGNVDPRPTTFDPRRSTGTPAFPAPQVARRGSTYKV
jgi:hypothetical protein